MMEMSAEATIAVMENLLKYGKYNIPTRNAMENAVRLLKDQQIPESTKTLIENQAKQMQT